MSKWRYAFNCRDCLETCELHDGVHDGRYCMQTLLGRNPIHADDDYVVRCDKWEPAQHTLFDGNACFYEEGDEYAEADMDE